MRRDVAQTNAPALRQQETLRSQRPCGRLLRTAPIVGERDFEQGERGKSIMASRPHPVGEG